ncbi:lysosome-associated membrane glycoprotein 1 [Hyposmocoma kahamanoa]|uniref:lysosome-associated membrane glycoprotein 1 n=1 Tax=Hyposmocoma kahamanoa TaxID=1477025 RepID=UPI000E6D8261|nr:lysosome-associated membrane glycoprotein 1 [Hyposmocoma kahamanoa]
MVFRAAGGKLPSYVPPIKISNIELERVYQYKYLGHFVSADLKDLMDIERERRALAVRCNMVVRSLWTNYTHRAISALRVQYNNGFRMLLGLPRFCSASATIDHLLLNVPDNATVPTGSCSGNNSQWLTISWPAPANTTNNLTLVFQRNDTTHNYALSAVNLTLSAHMFPNASMLTPTVESWHGAEWLTPLATSYRCAAPASLNMGAAHDSVTASLTLSQLQEEAFRSAHGTSFSAARECGGGDVPDAVPIAVGCALGGLVVVVLVAYLVARRRSAARGYLSM